MDLAEQIEHGKIENLFPNSKGKMRYRRYLKKKQKKAWRRFKEELKPMYNRFCGWEF